MELDRLVEAGHLTQVQFEALRRLSGERPLLVVGPTNSGKTRLAEALAADSHLVLMDDIRDAVEAITLVSGPPAVGTMWGTGAARSRQHLIHLQGASDVVSCEPLCSFRELVVVVTARGAGSRSWRVVDIDQ